MKKIWLRAENKANEFRRALSPQTVKRLVAAGFEVVAEDSQHSIISAEEYRQAGATIKNEFAWITEAPDDFTIIGLKNLPYENFALKHNHIYFAHAYKGQDGWQEILGRFKEGGGQVFDLEYLLNENNRRIAAFGYWAGYVGAALGIYFFHARDKEKAAADLLEKKMFINRDALKDFIRVHTKSHARGLVIGYMGRSGTGAMDCFTELLQNVTGWDSQDTKNQVELDKITNYDILVNCVLSNKKTTPFLTTEQLTNHKDRLRMISDVSCDPDSECNMLPIYKEATVLEKPLTKVGGSTPDVLLTAIDNLPSILPKESTEDFSAQLEPYLMEMSEDHPVWKGSLDIFKEKLNLI